MASGRPLPKGANQVADMWRGFFEEQAGGTLDHVGEVLGDRAHECRVEQGPCADMFLLHQWIKGDPDKVDLLIGNTYGKYMARDEDIPLVRHGFPILDRVGHQHFPTVGYRGATRLLEQILNAFLDRQDRDADEPSFELTM